MSCGCKPRSGPEFDPDFEGPSCEDLERFNSDLATCPDCGADLYHDATICPSCGHAIATPKAARAGLSRPIIGAVALIAGAAFILAYIL